MDSRVRILIHPALFIDIHPMNLTFLPKIVPPHRHAATAVDPNFDDGDGAAHKLLQVMMVRFKIMQPFPYASSFFDGIEIRSQRIWKIILGWCGCTRLQRL
jgi:hypothetical protein